jgi:hypothetical protein
MLMAYCGAAFLDAISYGEVWWSDGTEAGTMMVKTSIRRIKFIGHQFHLRMSTHFVFAANDNEMG